jgi:alpha-beta hydrolase superfamily lysophospholipase
MASHQVGRFGSMFLAGVVALGLIGVSLAQNPAGKTKGAARGKARPAAKKQRPDAADPFARAADLVGNDAPAGTFHYTLKLIAPDNVALAASYYPAKQGTLAPVVLLVHQKDRSSKDFDEPVNDLKGQGLAEHLQGLGYAVLTFDLRGHGANQRRALSPRDWERMVIDVQTAYRFLLDRNNRGELNLSKFGVLGVGEGANLVAAWATLPGAAVSVEERPSDLGALLLVSPVADGSGLTLGEAVRRTVTRFPTLIMVGDRDALSADPVKTVKPTVERVRINRVEVFPSSLHGYKLLRLEPKATSVVTRFLEGTVKFKGQTQEWEPRYNLLPAEVRDIAMVRNAKPVDAARAKAKAKAKAQPKDEEKPKDKARAKDEEKAKNDAKNDDNAAEK